MTKRSKRTAKPVGVFHETFIAAESADIRTITLIERYGDADNGSAIANLDAAIARLEDLKLSRLLHAALSLVTGLAFL